MYYTLFLTKPDNFYFRYHKNNRSEQPGWNRDTIQWCRETAQAKQLRDWDFLGGFVIDEMKIEVNMAATPIFIPVKTIIKAHNLSNTRDLFSLKTTVKKSFLPHLRTISSM